MSKRPDEDDSPSQREPTRDGDQPEEHDPDERRNTNLSTSETRPRGMEHLVNDPRYRQIWDELFRLVHEQLNAKKEQSAERGDDDQQSDDPPDQT